MDDELEERLDRIEKQVSETRKMVGELRSAQRRASFWRFIRFAIAILVVYLIFKAIQPYIVQLSGLYESMKGILP